MDPMDYQMEPGPSETTANNHNGPASGLCPYRQGANDAFAPPQLSPAHMYAGYLPGHWNNNERQILPSLLSLYGNRPQQAPGIGSPSSDSTSRQRQDDGDPMVTDGLDPRAPVYYSQQSAGTTEANQVAQGQTAEDSFENPWSHPPQHTRMHHSLRLPTIGQLGSPFGQLGNYAGPHRANSSYRQAYPTQTPPIPPQRENVALPPISQDAYGHPRPYSNYHEPLSQFPNVRAPSAPSSEFSAGLGGPRPLATLRPTEPMTFEPVLVLDPHTSLRTRRRPTAEEISLTYPEEPDLGSSDESDGDDSLEEQEELSQFRHHPSDPRVAYYRNSEGAAAARRAAEVHGDMYLRARERDASRIPSIPRKLVATELALASFVKVEKSSLKEEDTTCIICYNEFGIVNPDGNIEAPVRLPKCQHLFGDHCLKQWLQDSDSCPYCRDKLPSEPKRRTPPIGRGVARPGFHHGWISPEELAANSHAVRTAGERQQSQTRNISTLHFTSADIRRSNGTSSPPSMPVRRNSQDSLSPRHRRPRGNSSRHVTIPARVAPTQHDAGHQSNAATSHNVVNPTSSPPRAPTAHLISSNPNAAARAAILMEQERRWVAEFGNAWPPAGHGRARPVRQARPSSLPSATSSSGSGEGQAVVPSSHALQGTSNPPILPSVPQISSFGEALPSEWMQQPSLTPNPSMFMRPRGGTGQNWSSPPRMPILHPGFQVPNDASTANNGYTNPANGEPYYMQPQRRQ